jgi:cytochrome c oxidase subunit III
VNHLPRLGTPSLDGEALSSQLTGLKSPIIWGVLLLIAIEGTLLALFIVSYFYLQLGADAWPPPTVTNPDLLVPTLGQVLMLASALPVWFALRDLPRGNVRGLVLGLPVGIFLALGYLVLTAMQYAARDYLWDDHVYGSLDWTMGGYAALHVVVVVLAGVVVWALGLRGHFGRDRYTGVQALALYWLFAAAGSLAFYVVQYLSPRL